MSGLLASLLEGIPVPRVAKVRQSFPADELDDAAASLAEELKRPGGIEAVRPGQRVAVCVGSRGVAQLDRLTAAVVAAVKERGALPFIVPSMASHGGATAEGQVAVLRHLGITEERVGAPVVSSMDVRKVGELPNGLPVYVDEQAAAADSVIVINRIKPHTAFRGPVESGLLKMISVGMGNQKGAEACHRLGFHAMGENIVKMARVILEKVPIVLGVAVVENAYDRVCRVEAVPAREIEAREPLLLEEAKRRMPRLLFDPIDVLVIDRIGKNISGDGMDPNVTGRYPTTAAHGGPDVRKMVVLDLTPQSGGNANGVGTADFTTQRLVDKMDREATYANGLTSTVCSPTKIPTTLPNDLLAIRAAVKTCNVLRYELCRLVRIRDTLHLGEIEVSESLLREAREREGVEVLSEPYEWTFDAGGSLLS